MFLREFYEVRTQVYKTTFFFKTLETWETGIWNGKGEGSEHGDTSSPSFLPFSRYSPAEFPCLRRLVPNHQLLSNSSLPLLLLGVLAPSSIVCLSLWRIQHPTRMCIWCFWYVITVVPLRSTKQSPVPAQTHPAVGLPCQMPAEHIETVKHATRHTTHTTHTHTTHNTHNTTQHTHRNKTGETTIQCNERNSILNHRFTFVGIPTTTCECDSDLSGCARLRPNMRPPMFLKERRPEDSKGGERQKAR